MDTQYHIQLVDAAALGDMLGVKAKLVLQWARDGLIPCLRISDRTIRFDPEVVARTLTERAAQTTSHFQEVSA